MDSFDKISSMSVTRASSGAILPLPANRCRTERRFNNDVPFTLIDTLGGPARPRGFGCCPHATLLPAFGRGLGGLAG